MAESSEHGSPLRILVVGAGAVGGYYGALLARAGHAVTLVARGEHGRVIREAGLFVAIGSNEIHVHAPVVEDVREAAGLGADVAIVAVKAVDLAGVAAGTGAALAANGLAVPLLNGLDSEKELADAIGRERVVGGVAQVAARIEKPGRIRAEAEGSILLAPLLAGQMPRVESLAQTFAAAGFACDAKADLARVLWTKLVWNAPFNGVCALTRRTAGEVLAVPELEALVRAGMQEVVAVGRAEGVALPDSLVEAMIGSTRSRFAASFPSMLQDVLAGKPTEARALQGAVVARAAVHGISTPVHTALLALILGLERSGS